MHGRVIPVRSMQATEIEAWRDLATRAAEPNPLFEPACLLPAARHLPDGADIDLVVAEEGGRLYGCLAVRRIPRWGAFRQPVLSTYVLRVQYDGTPLLDPDRGADAAASMLEVLGDRRAATGAGHLVLDRLDDGGPVAEAFLRAVAHLGLASYRYDSWVRPVVRRRPDLTYRSDHGTKMLRHLRQHRRALGRLMGEDVQLVDRSGDPSALDAVVALEAAGYKSASGAALTCHQGEPEWFREMCGTFGRAGRLHVYTLEAAGAVAAVQVLVRGGEGLFGLKTTYDQRYARRQPGIQLHLDVIDHVHTSTTVDWIDTCAAKGNETLLHLYPDRRPVTQLVVAVGGASDRVALRALRGLHRLKSGIAELGDRRRSNGDRSTSPLASAGDRR